MTIPTTPCATLPYTPPLDNIDISFDGLNSLNTKITEISGLIFHNGVPISYAEPLHGCGWGQRFSVQRILLDEDTPFQRLRILETKTLGKVLVLDDAVQLTEMDHKTYSEMMAHVPILAHGHVKKVLIIGGGDGSVLREVLRHKGIEKATLVEIDGRVIEATKDHMHEVCQTAFEDPRAHVVIQDAVQYVKDCKEIFDVIICDSTDPFGCGAPLFSPEFYGDCHGLLGPRGIFVNQNGVPSLQPEEIKTISNRKAHFAHAGFYQVVVPTYVGGSMLLGWASDDNSWLTLSNEILEERLSTLSGTMQYYTPKIHQAAFALPAFVEQKTMTALSEKAVFSSSESHPKG